VTPSAIIIHLEEREELSLECFNKVEGAHGYLRGVYIYSTAGSCQVVLMPGFRGGKEFGRQVTFKTWFVHFSFWGG